LIFDAERNMIAVESVEFLREKQMFTAENAESAEW
jgi:hypothetical protein